MTFEQDPPRLSRIGSSQLRDALCEAKAELPGEERLAAIGAAINLGAALDIGAGTVLSAKAAPVLGASLGASKIAAVALAVVVGTTTYYTAELIEARSAAPRAEVTQVARRTRVLERAVAAEQYVIVEAVPEEEATVTEVPAPEAAPVVAPESTPDAAVPSEVSLLADARAALAASPARALRLLEEHRRAYPSGALAQERDVMAIEAFAALGRSDVVVKRAERFLAAHEGSAHTARLRILLERARRAEDAAGDTTPP